MMDRCGSKNKKDYTPKTGIVVAGGDILWPADSEQLLSNVSMIVAADSGAAHLLEKGRLPDLVVGDMDSLKESAREILKDNNIRFACFSRHKDKTDLEIAVSEICETGIEKIFFLGMLGGRWDMSFGNAMALFMPCLEGKEAILCHGDWKIQPVTGPCEITITGNANDLVSLVPAGGDCVGITLGGFYYPLKNETLLFSQCRGISNRLRREKGEIRLKKGRMLLLHKKSNS